MMCAIDLEHNAAIDPRGRRLRRGIMWGVVLLLIIVALSLTVLRVYSPLPGLQEELGTWTGTLEGPMSSEQLPLKSAIIQSEAGVDLTMTEREWTLLPLQKKQFFHTAKRDLTAIGRRYGVHCIILRVRDSAGHLIHQERIDTRRPIRKSAFCREIDKWHMSLLDSKAHTGVVYIWPSDQRSDLYVIDEKWNSLPRQKQDEFLRTARQDLSAICRRHGRAADCILIRVLSAKKNSDTIYYEEERE